MSAAIKHDKDKARYDLISAYALEALAKVLAFGANKYGERNWEAGANDPIFMGKVFAAGQRHSWAPRMGDQYDEESGYPHSWHELCNAMFKAHRDMLIWKHQGGARPSQHPMTADYLRDEYEKGDGETGV